MKPKMLKHPFSWDERKVLIKDQVWYVPEYYDQYESFPFPGWEHEDLFHNKKPVMVEYCSGNGTWLSAKAQQFPEYNWVGVEKQFKRVRKLWSKAKNQSIHNMIALCGEAYTATRHYFPTESIHDIFINFPDPWPKNKHAKHRLIHREFVHEMWRILRSEGTVTVVTDDDHYSAQVIEEMHPRFKSVFAPPYFVTQFEGYGSSFFEELWRSQGKTIRYHQFRKES